MKLFSGLSVQRHVLRAALLAILVLSGGLHLFGQPSEVPKKLVQRSYDLLPLAFEPNQGQSTPDAEFLARAPGFSAVFKENQTELFFPGFDATGGPLRMTLLKSSPNALAAGEKRLPGTVNYFSGTDRKNWHTGLPTFERLRYSNIYPHTDLIYYGNKGSLEFDFQLAPRADPGLIQMRFEGAQRLKIDRNGNLIVTAIGGHISFQRPVIYQSVEGARKDFIAGSFKVLGKKTVRFSVGKYDHAKTLIIDPILDYSTYIGSFAQATSIAVDQNGEAYVTGIASQTFPVTPGSYQPAGKSCVGQFWPNCASPFVAKFNSTGTAMLYSTFLTGNGVDAASAIALDASGDAFVVGTTSSTNFPVTSGSLQAKDKASSTTGFITELNSTGTSLIYSTYLGGSTSTYVNGVAIDAAGNAYLTGRTSDTDFPATPGSYQASPISKAASSSSAFVAKLNPTGTALVYATYLGGNQTDIANAIAVDSAGETYVGGTTTSNNFPVTPGAVQQSREATNVQAGFVAKLNASGSALVYSTCLGGNDFDNLTSIALDSNTDVYATGSTNSPDFPITSGALQSKIGISYFNYPQVNAFVAEINTSGTALLYSTFLGGGISLGPLADEGDQANRIAVDTQGNVYLTGTACTAAFPVTAGAFESQNLDGEFTGECTAFLTKMNPQPNTPLLYSTFLGGTGNGDAGDYFYGEQAYGLAIDPLANVYLAGYTLSIDFPTTAGVVQTSFTGPSEEAFVTKFNASEMKSLPAPAITLTSNTSSVLFGQPVTFTATVRPASGNNTPSGSVGFNFLQQEASDDEGPGAGFGPWTTVPLNGAGIATFTTSALEALQTQVNAFYLGDANNAPVEGTMIQTVSDIPTVTTVTSSANNVPYNSPVVLTATVLDNTGKPAKGFVFFLQGNDSFAESSLDANGQATWVNGTGGPPLPVGTNTIGVEFFPNTGYQKSTGTLAVTFTALGTMPAPTFKPPAGTYTAGQSVSLADSSTTGYNIYYTTDGTNPVPGSSSEYLNFPLWVASNETIKAIAVDFVGYSPSNVASASYTINIPPPGFTTGPGATTTMTVPAGSAYPTNGTVSVIGTNGFSGVVNLQCTVTTTMTAVNDMPGCTLYPGSVTIGGADAQTSILTVTTTLPSSAENRTRLPFWAASGGTALALALLFGGFTRRRSSFPFLGLIVLWMSVGSLGCGSANPAKNAGLIVPGTTAGNYTVTITGTSAGITSTVGTVALTVE